MFVSLSSKLLEQRVHIACKEIVTLENQVCVAILILFDNLLNLSRRFYTYSSTPLSLTLAEKTSRGRRERRGEKRKEKKKRKGEKTSEKGEVEGKRTRKRAEESKV